jgi:hypothetical protein
MKKVLAILMLCCLMLCSTRVHAENFEWTEEIHRGEKKVITIPEPEGDIKNNWVYFTQYFIFEPEQSGTYQFLVSYEDDASDPYDIYMDISGYTIVNGEKRYITDEGYWDIENGCEFEAREGFTYELMFQYNTYDGRNPEFTFYLLSKMTDPSEYMENFWSEEDIACGEKKVITIPQPDREINKNWVYYTKTFIFTPEVDGTYNFVINTEDDFDPENVYMDVTPFFMVDQYKQYASDQGFWELPNGCKFEGRVGRSYELTFQYMSDDGQYPEFTFYVESDGTSPNNPQTGDGAFLPVGMMAVSAMLAVCLFTLRKKML